LTTLRFSPFGGLMPKADGTMLPANAAQRAVNCRFSAGQLEAFNLPTQVYTTEITSIDTIYRFGQATNSDTNYWFIFPTIVDVVKGAIANDTEERTFYTDGTLPKVTKSDLAVDSLPYPTNYYRLGIPAPTSAIIATVSGTASSDTAVAETRIYTYTFVDGLGQESAPATESNEVDVKPGQLVTIQMGTVPAGPYAVTHKRIYRSVSGTSGTEFLLVAEVPAGTNAYDDSIDANGLGEVLPTLEHALLPDTAKGLCSGPNGMAAAHTEYDVYFCEPFKYYAWPEGYIQTVDYPIVGMAYFGTSLAVLTQGVPYIMSGTDPSSVSVEKLSVAYACLSKKSICAALGGVLYAAADGLVSIDYSGPKVLTDQLFTRRDWMALNPASMMVCVWDERIFMFYDTGVVKGGLILDSANGLTTTDIHATAAFTDPVTGSLFLAVDDKIVKWDAGMEGTYTWKSRQETLPIPQNFGWGQVLATTYPITANVYADGVLAHTETVASDLPFRLPSGFRARYWEIELVGKGRVRAAALADSSAELQGV
jgi:hypothetical protein